MGEDMDLPKHLEMTRYYAHKPPVHISVARYLGYEEKVEKPPQKTEDAAVAELMALFPMVQ